MNNIFLTKLECVAVNVKSWLRLRGHVQLPWEVGRRKKKMKDMVQIM